jgi:hypothetical protein
MTTQQSLKKRKNNLELESTKNIKLNGFSDKQNLRKNITRMFSLQERLISSG